MMAGVPVESINLIYIDPPFGFDGDSKFFGMPKWSTLDYPANRIDDILPIIPHDIGTRNYLRWLFDRLEQMYRILAEDGSIYVHCDWRVNSLIRLALDEAFGKENLRSEIIWWYLWGGRGREAWNKKHDMILFYTKGRRWIFNCLDVLDDHQLMSDSARDRVKYKGALVHHREGKDGDIPREKTLPSDTWYIATINAMASERENYPTQKPEALLERIIKASSNEGDIVADFFVGSGTTAAVAEKLGRKWIGVDISERACGIARQRIVEAQSQPELELSQK